MLDMDAFKRSGKSMQELIGYRMYSDDRMRGGASTRRYDARWREARALFLKQHPLCAFCQAEGKIVPATVVDHIIPHRGDQRLFWDQKDPDGRIDFLSMIFIKRAEDTIRRILRTYG